jgi:hypothetical protein
MAVAEALDARKAGTHPYAHFWTPTGGDTRHFYFAELHQREAEGKPLGKRRDWSFRGESHFWGSRQPR